MSKRAVTKRAVTKRAVTKRAVTKRKADDEASEEKEPVAKKQKQYLFTFTGILDVTMGGEIKQARGTCPVTVQFAVTKNADEQGACDATFEAGTMACGKIYDHFYDTEVTKFMHAAKSKDPTLALLNLLNVEKATLTSLCCVVAQNR
jgi:hypothetical protein